VSLQEYRAFIASKAPQVSMAGFDPKPINPASKTHQTVALDYALRKGRSAVFLDTGPARIVAEELIRLGAR
jgi:hypothetical protein